jgi:hypothetical protein
MFDGVDLHAVGFVKALSKAGLPAFFEDWLYVIAPHIGHKEFDGISTDIDDGAAHGIHSTL